MRLPSAVFTGAGLQSRPGKAQRILTAGFVLLLILAATGLDAEPAVKLDIAPEQCGWHSGRTAPWAEAIAASDWRPYADWKLNPHEPYVWVRCTFDPAPLSALEHPAAQAHIAAAYEARLDGVLIGRNGNMASGTFTLDFIRTWPIPPSMLRTRPGELAVLEFRIVYRTVGASLLAPVGPLHPSIGDQRRLLDAKAGDISRELPSDLLTSAPFILLGLVGCVLLSIWLPEHADRTSILLALNCVLVGLVFCLGLSSATRLPIPFFLVVILNSLGKAGNALCITVFYFAIAGRRTPIIARVMIGLVVLIELVPIIPLALPPVQAVAIDAGLITKLGAAYLVVFGLLSLSPFVSFWPYHRIAPRLRLIAMILMLDGLSRATIFFGITKGFAFSTRLMSITFTSNQIGSFLALAGLIGIVLRQQRAAVRQRAELTGEMQAAQQIQQKLVASSVASLEAIRIEVAFHPAREVGGDFYSCRVLPGNRQRILIGDVSGKGAAAVMTAAVLLGAAQNCEQESPAALLGQLNRVMTGMHIGGFATCLCAEIDADGCLSFANAGHLAPYRNHQEVPIQNALPLGIIAEAEYAEDSLRLAPGDVLTFISDGVVEARGPAGDLFGFDRTREISNQSASAIATAAKRFGQEDDITVITLMFAGAPSFAERPRTATQ